MYWSPARRNRVRERCAPGFTFDRSRRTDSGPTTDCATRLCFPASKTGGGPHPGAHWDSCCYFHAETKSLISGDTLLGSAKKNRLVLPSVFSNRSQIRSSVRRLEALMPEHVYPGHGSEFHGENLLPSL